jgi:hypothetical protein
MREIKFRAWHKGSNNVKPHMGYSDFDLEKFFRLYDGWDIMQYTGLHDKNGKEIYEGDIVRCKYQLRAIWVETVEWSEELAGFAPMCFPRGYDEQHIEEYEVLGNIYENPELLKEGK